MAGMNPFLAELYKTQETIEKNAAAQTEKTAQAQLLDELEKVAAAEGINLEEFSDEEIAGILNDVIAQGTEKTAGGASAEQFTPEQQEKVAEADFLGRTMAHSFYQELSTIQSGGDAPTGSAAFMKQANAGGEVDPEFLQAVEDAATERANAILEMLDGSEVKTSSISVGDEELNAIVGQRAAELLDAAGYDVEAIAQHLSAQEGA